MRPVIQASRRAGSARAARGQPGRPGCRTSQARHGGLRHHLVQQPGVAAQFRVRTRDEIAALFGGFMWSSRDLRGYLNGGPTRPAMCRENPKQLWALVGAARLGA